MRFSRTLLIGSAAIISAYALALIIVFESPVFNIWYVSHLLVYTVAAFIALMVVWGMYPLKQWRISLFVFLVLLIALDIGVFIKDIDPQSLIVHKEFSAEYGVVNSRNYETTVTYTNDRDGDLINLYSLDARNLPHELYHPETHVFDYSIDNEGFRNTHTAKESDVIFIGDSMTIVSSLPTENGWPAIAAQQAGVIGYNLGVNQIGPNNYEKLLRGYGPGKKAAVIAFFEGNDYDKLYYEVPMNPAKKHLWYWLSYIINNTGKEKFTPLKTDYNIPAFTIAGKKFPMIFYEHYANILQRSDEEIRDHSSYNALTVIFSEMKDVCLENNIECIFLYIPTKLRVYMPYIKNQFDLKTMYEDLGNPLEIYHSSVAYYMNEQEKAVKALIQEYAPNIHYVSATELLRTFAAEGELVYYPYDTHLNIKGNELVGTLVAEKLSELLH